MIARIAVFGTESTGKTTLAQQLARCFDEPWAPEFVRDFWNQHNGNIKSTDLSEIARGQIDNEETAASRARHLVICDTDLITNTIWADLLFPGRCPQWVREAAELRCRQYILYLLCDTDIPFVDDGQRCFPDPEDRARCRALWRAALIGRGLPFVDIHGPWSERFDAAHEAITRKLGR